MHALGIAQKINVTFCGSGVHLLRSWQTGLDMSLGRDWSILFLALAVLLFVLVIAIWVVRVKAEAGLLPSHAAEVIHASSTWLISD
jgi:hypothetical protein